MPGSTGGGWHGVVAGFDGTDRGRCAVRWAAARAVGHGCPLYVVSVVELVPPMASGWAAIMAGANVGERCWSEQRLLVEVEACRAAFPGLEVRASLHEGHPCGRLADYADQVGADLIAVGESSRGRWSRLLLGSTADELLRRTGRLVAVVRDPTPVQQATMLTGQCPVVASVEDVVGGGPVLDFAFDAAVSDDAVLTVVAPRDLRGVGVVEQVDRWRRRFPQVPVTIDTVTGDRLPALLEAAEVARLLVVGHRPTGTFRWLAGSVSDTVAHDAACSVVVVRPGAREQAGPLWASGRPRAGR